MFEKLKQGLKSFVEKITTKTLSEGKLDEVLWDLKLLLISNDVAVDVTDKIAEEIKSKLVGRKVGLLEDVRAIVRDALKETLVKILTLNEKKNSTLLELIKKKEEKPFKIVFVGFNGVGKTLTISKIAKLLKNKGYSVVIAASDTFRAGSIEQIEKHAAALNIKVIKHKYGADAAAVAYDAVNYAKARKIDVVLVDTAGRVQTDKNLMDEMKKIVRICDPDLVIFVGDALAGNDAARQVEEFIKAVEIDGTILTKVDADVKGGAAISVSYISRKPIFYIGTGGGYDDLKEFDPEEFVDMIMPS
ncbi:MAG: signal recognition particle-docking protein FtsY [Candidatus Odinarchaeia archaeon]